MPDKQQEKIKELRRQVEQVLSSSHVSSVKVAFEYEANGVRYYTAISTRNKVEQHRYTVKFAEDADGDRYGHCNCAASAKDMLCRHILKAAALDTELYGKPIYAETVVRYRAHLQYERRKAA